MPHCSLAFIFRAPRAFWTEPNCDSLKGDDQQTVGSGTPHRQRGSVLSSVLL